MCELWRRLIRLRICTAAVQRYPTDVVLLEGGMLTGTANAIPELLRIAPNVKIIVQASHSDESHTVELYRRGVRGIISRAISPDLLVKCIRKIAGGETWIDNQSVNLVIEAYRSQAASLVSPKTPAETFSERDVDHHLHHAGQAEQGNRIPAWNDGTSNQELSAQDLR